MSKQNLEPLINPRAKNFDKNAIGHSMKPLAPHPASTDAQMSGVAKGGLGHATIKAVPGSNPLDVPTQYVKGVALQTENVPNTVGSRNRSGE